MRLVHLNLQNIALPMNLILLNLWCFLQVKKILPIKDGLDAQTDQIPEALMQADLLKTNACISTATT